ncbi:MAG: barstar family protein [Erysipelotrichaceae bacterium]|nr:barstar family protein [Erysipelotrichaceae bacterium]
MIHIVIDGKLLKTKAMFHEHMVKSLAFPYYYGNNLDALWDILSTTSEVIDIMLVNQKDLRHSLGDYANAIIALLEEVTKVNSMIKFYQIKDE